MAFIIFYFFWKKLKKLKKQVFSQIWMYYIKVSYCRTGYLDWACELYFQDFLTYFKIIFSIQTCFSSISVSGFWSFCATDSTNWRKKNMKYFSSWLSGYYSSYTSRKMIWINFAGQQRLLILTNPWEKLQSWSKSFF
jgi:hypothetical protein